LFIPFSDPGRTPPAVYPAYAAAMVARDFPENPENYH
jgi:hypothetical protein